MTYGIQTIIHETIGLELKFLKMANGRQSTNHIIKMWINPNKQKPSLVAKMFHTCNFSQKEQRGL